MQLIESKTYLNLARSYAGECQAQVRYKFIEYGARKEGYTCLAEMIDKIVYNEFNHARMFYTYLQKATTKTIENIDVCAGYPFKERWDLMENLKLAAEDEREEFEKIYPAFKQTALDEGFEDIAKLKSSEQSTTSSEVLSVLSGSEAVNVSLLPSSSNNTQSKTGIVFFELITRLMVCKRDDSKELDTVKFIV